MIITFYISIHSIGHGLYGYRVDSLLRGILPILILYIKAILPQSLRRVPSFSSSKGIHPRPPVLIEEKASQTAFSNIDTTKFISHQATA